MNGNDEPIHDAQGGTYGDSLQPRHEEQPQVETLTKGELMSVMNIYGDGITDVIMDRTKDLEYRSSSYTHFFLQQEGVPYEITHLTVNEDNLEAVMEEIRRMNPTIVAPGDPGKIKMVRLLDRGWLELEAASISSGPKSLKRMNTFFQQTYLHVSYDIEDITIEYVDVPPIAASYHDGRIFIGGRILRDMLEVVRHNLLNDPEIDDELIPLILEKLSGRAFNIRGLLPTGFLKGDAVLVPELSHDLVIMDPRNNVKPEIHGPDNVVHLHMFPQEQWGEVRANRQMLSMVGDWLLPERFIEDAFTDVVNDGIEKVRRGEPVYLDKLGSVEPDAVTKMQTKMATFHEVVGDLNESIHLTQMNARHFSQTKTHVRRFKDEVIKHFPVPFAVRMSIRNSVDYETVYGVAPQINVGEVTFTPFGVIMPDLMELGGDIVTDAIERLHACHGGSDGDDHLVLHLRKAADDDAFFGISAGDIITVNIREPQGLASDGKSLFLEFSITKVAANALPALMEHFGITSVDEIPLLSLADRPKSVMELTLIEYPWTLTGPTGDGELNMDYVFEQVKLIVASSGYGIHANQMMAAARHGFVFKPIASEEDWIDEFTNPTPEGVNILNQANEDLRELLMASDIVFDPHEARRLGFYDKETDTFLVHTEPGIFSHLVDYHQDEMNRFHLEVTEHIHHLKARHQARGTAMFNSLAVARVWVRNAAGSPITDQFDERVPAVLGRLYTEEKRYRAQHNLKMDPYISKNHDVEVARTVLHEMGAAVREGRMTPDQARKMIVEAFLFSYEALVPAYSASQGRVFSFGDRMLFTDPLFSKVLEILSSYGSALIPIREYQVDEDLQVIRL